MKPCCKGCATVSTMSWTRGAGDGTAHEGRAARVVRSRAQGGQRQAQQAVRRLTPGRHVGAPRGGAAEDDVGNHKCEATKSVARCGRGWNIPQRSCLYINSSSPTVHLV
ncbi:hypothetical protein AUP68_11143 [Ilyonectria robusta]